MNFEKWQEKELGDSYDPNEKDLARYAWDGCKKEVLKIIFDYPDESLSDFVKEFRYQIIKEIEKL